MPVNKEGEGLRFFDINDPRRARYSCCSDILKSVFSNQTRG